MQAKATLIQNLGALDATRCKTIRASMKKIFVEREVQRGIYKKQAPCMTIQDMEVLGKMFHAQGAAQQ